MNLDAAFVIGDTHTVCQDYAFSLMIEDRGYLMVSDGCSSSPHTDMGARLFIHQLITCLTEGKRLSQEVLLDALTRARSLLDQLKLPREALDCTLLAAECDAEYVRVFAMGDGVIAIDHREGALSGIEIISPNQAPGYLNYWGDDARLSLYLEHDQGVTYRRLGSDQEEHYVSAFKLLSFTLSSSELRSLVLCSDGVSSLSGVSVEEVLTHLTRFPVPEGAFVQRRLRKFTRKVCKRYAWTHRDDLALAAVTFGS